ncbi:hypothetical protein, partial [Escherichia coli]|uniref:hypothetical protein n=1 Tax=Escherichia coli TaxID=562 RepID=UPI00192C2465
EKSWPKFGLMIAAAMVAGAGLGFAGALLKDLFDSTVRNTEQLHSLFGTNNVTAIPEIYEQKSRGRLIGGSWRKGVKLNFAAENPSSRFSESLRRVRLAIDEQGSGENQVIAFISSMPSEGKSTCAANLASTIG